MLASVNIGQHASDAYQSMVEPQGTGGVTGWSNEAVERWSGEVAIAVLACGNGSCRENSLHLAHSASTPAETHGAEEFSLRVSK